MANGLIALHSGEALDTADVTVAELFQVLSSPIRLKVVRLLLEGELCVGDLIERMGIAQPRLSNHLACLRNCGVVQTRRQGTFIFYAIVDSRVAEIVRMGEAIATTNALALDRCEVLRHEQ